LKFLSIAYFVFLLTPTFSQNVENTIFIGSSVGLYNYSHVRIGATQYLRDKKYLIELSYNTDLTDHLLQLKVGFRLFRIDKVGLRTYVYFPPYMNLSIIDGKYNTPFCFEVIKDRIFKKEYLSTGINIDIFKDRVVPQIRFTANLFSWKK